MFASVSDQQSIERPDAWLAGRWTPWVWAGMSFLAYLVAPYLARGALAPGSQLLPNAGQAILPVAWTLLAALGVGVAARIWICFGARPRVDVGAATLLIAGAVLAAAVDASLHAWAAQRFGYFEPEIVGPTSIFFALVVAVTVAGFGSLIGPRRAALPPALAALAGVGMSGLALVGNLGGLADGLDPESIAPALIIGLASVYVFVVGVVATRAWLRAHAARR